MAESGHFALTKLGALDCQFKGNDVSARWQLNWNSWVCGETVAAHIDALKHNFSNKF
jgi:hypothetical protein